MHLLHFTTRRLLSLHAEGLLHGSEAARVDARIASCASCRREFEGLAAVVRTLRADDALRAEPPIPTGALAARIRARLREESAAPLVAAAAEPSRAFAFGAAGVAVLALALLARQSTRPTPPDDAARGVSIGAPAAPDDEAAFYERLEREQVRVSAARYLAEAQDVLVHVAALSDDCLQHDASEHGSLSREAEKSRDLLLLRAHLTPEHQESLAAARSVIEDVEGVLREVAELPRCTRREELDAIRRSLDRKKLLMKIDLVSQELAG